LKHDAALLSLLLFNSAVGYTIWKAGENGGNLMELNGKHKRLVCAAPVCLLAIKDNTETVRNKKDNVVLEHPVALCPLFSHVFTGILHATH
jgi:hypothetical protein